MWLLRFFTKHRGSVSILMAIIMLPTLTVVGILVDLANRNLSKAMVENAGELAASSALSHYDTVLADVYGLFAMSQTEEDLSANLEAYINNTLDAAGLLDPDLGLDSDTLNSLQEMVQGALGSVTSEDLGPDIMDIAVTDVSAQGVELSALSNPDMLKGQIVEFMKYRGVAEVGMDLISSLNALKSVQEKAEVTDAQMEVQESVSELGDEVGSFYRKIVLCDNTVKQIQDLYRAVDWYGIRVMLEGCNLNVAELAFRADLEDYVYELKQNSSGDFIVVHYTYEEILEDSRTVTRAKYDDDFAAMRNEVDTLIAELRPDGMGAWDPMPENAIDTDLEDYFANSYYPRMEKIIPLTDYGMGLSQKVRELTAQLSALQAAEEPDEAEIAAVAQLLAEHQGLLNDIQNALFIAASYMRGAFKFTHDYVSYNKQRYYGLYSTLGRVHDELYPLYETVHAAKLMDDMLDIFNDAIKAGEAVKEKIRAVEASNENLSAAAETYAENQSRDDYYAGIQSEVENTESYCNEESVDEIIEQLESVRRYLFADVRAEGVDKNGKAGLYVLLQEPFYGCDLTEAGEDMDARESLAISKEAKRLAELNSTRDNIQEPESVEALYDGYVRVMQEEKLNNVGASTGDAYLKQIREVLTKEKDHVDVGVPRYYVYLLNNCGVKAKSGEEEVDANVEGNAQEMGDKAKEAVKGDPETQHYSYMSFSGVLGANGDAPDTDSMEVEEGKTGIIKMLGNMLDTFADLTSGLDKAVEGARDNLLTTQYIFENFSNHVMTTQKYRANEGLVDGQFFKTMTNVDISGTNNALFGCEVEYILYGYRGSLADPSTGPQDNIKTARNRIFVVRFVCNTIYALSSSEIRLETTPPAMAIQAATLGVFPYQVARVVLQLCLALAETIYDMGKIMDGEKVVLLKSSQTWTMSAKGACKALVDEATEEVLKQVNTASAQIFNALQEYVDNGVAYVAGKVTNAAGNIVDGTAAALSESLNACLESMLRGVSDEVENIYFSIFDAATQLVSIDEAYVREKLTAAVNKYLDEVSGSSVTGPVADFLKSKSGDAVDFVMKYEVKSGVSIASFLSSYSQKVQQSLDSGTVAALELSAEECQSLTTALAAIPNSYIQNVADDVKGLTEEWVGGLQDEVSGYLNEGIQGVEDQANSMTAAAAQKVKNSVYGKIDEFFPGQGNMEINGTAAGKTSLASSIRFGYADYLRLFLFLGLLADSDAVVGRVAEVITLNMRHGLVMNDGTQHPCKDTFHMNKAYSYVEISAQVEIKPFLLSNELVRHMGADEIDAHSSLWSYPYSCIAGY